MKNYHHNSNDYILNSHINLTFNELRGLNEDQFLKWIDDFILEIKTSWVEHHQPPLKTIDDGKIAHQFQKINELDVSNSLVMNELTLEDNVIEVKSRFAAPNCFFPNMGMMTDNSSSTKEGLSLWDYFIEGKNKKSLIAIVRRNFKYDSFYKFAEIVRKDNKNSRGINDGEKWVRNFINNPMDGYDFYIENDSDKSTRRNIIISSKTLAKLQNDNVLQPKHYRNHSPEEIDASIKCRIRVYRVNQKIFPKGFKFLRSGLVVMGTNFPVSIAKYLYERFTESLKEQERIVIYDASAGYGGRMVAALSMNKDRHIHYVGTDPNPEHFITDLDMSSYDYMGWFYNNNVFSPHKTTYETFMVGSEVIHQNKEFQKYKGEVDFIFTSPPYFCAEGYSPDKNQSYKKFPKYEDWRDGFLAPTLKTCADYLKKDRWICWNIADVKLDTRHIPLERDTIEIMKSLGMEYKMTLKMLLSGSITETQVSSQTRHPVSRNFCKVNGSWRKYEPIFCFYKK